MGLFSRGYLSSHGCDAKQEITFQYKKDQDDYKDDDGDGENGDHDDDDDDDEDDGDDDRVRVFSNHAEKWRHARVARDSEDTCHWFSSCQMQICIIPSDSNYKILVNKIRYDCNVGSAVKVLKLKIKESSLQFHYTELF